MRRIDSHVGDLPHDDPLENRIVHAEQQSQFPWQFCFILGGGWRRAAGSAVAARAAQADIALAGIAILQLASRDARPSFQNVAALLNIAGLTMAKTRDSLDWLTHQRLIIGEHDLRSPHQRFAVVVIHRILEGQETLGREQIGRLLQHVVTDIDYPLAGLRLLLDGLLSSTNPWQWRSLIPEASLEPLIERCWQASRPEDRTFASLLLSEIRPYVRGWPGKQLEGRENILGQWISNPAEPSGYGLARLIHAVRNEDQKFARNLLESSDPRTLATAVSAVTPKTAYNLGEMLGALHLEADLPWDHTFLESLDRTKVKSFAASWPESEPAVTFANFCQGMSYCDETLALDMLEGFIPVAQKLFSKDPISALQ